MQYQLVNKHQERNKREHTQTVVRTDSNKKASTQIKSRKELEEAARGGRGTRFMRTSIIVYYKCVCRTREQLLRFLFHISRAIRTLATSMLRYCARGDAPQNALLHFRVVPDFW